MNQSNTQPNKQSLSAMHSEAIRAAFLDFFVQHEHLLSPSAPLVPNDPSLLFVNAGMVPFKPYFLALNIPPAKNIVSAQLAVRAGGKHNDLENVGFTARHHTLFEMLGNFSFDGYFKKDAIRFAWQLLTEVFGLSKDKLYITVHETDDEAFNIWAQDIGVPVEKIIRLGDKSNFWQMGDTGPCGPCAEIFYDHGAQVPGDKPGTPDEDGDRYIEIWNMVFMQFNRLADGTLVPLERPCIDTGMGLERITAVLQGTHDNYLTDLFAPYFEKIAQLCNCSFEEARESRFARVLADHARTCVFLIAQGVLPGSEGRGYVLRRIMRRALRFAYEMKLSGALSALAPIVIKKMHTPYPELKTQAAYILSEIAKEEARFEKTLSHGLALLNSVFEKMRAETEHELRVAKPQLSGADAFKLYDTYGFPLDICIDVARDWGFGVDEAGFHDAMRAQQARSRAHQGFSALDGEALLIQTDTSSSPEREVQLTELFVHDDEGFTATPTLQAKQHGLLITRTTPFYAQGGGQVGDSGRFVSEDGSVFVVKNTCKYNGKIAHVGYVKSGVFNDASVLAKNTELTLTVTAEVNAGTHQQTAAAHTATHLLHEALIQTLGTHVAQKGSDVQPGRLRFDFSHDSALSAKQIQQVQNALDAQINANLKVTTQEMPIAEAKAVGAKALFGEKYGDTVRVVRIGNAENVFSVELCGGSHVTQTAEIGVAQIISQSAVSAGIRRLELYVAQSAIKYYRAQQDTLNTLAVRLKAPDDKLINAVDKLLESRKDLKLQLAELQRAFSGDRLGALKGATQKVGELNLLMAKLEPAAQTNEAREMVDTLKQQLTPAIIVLAQVNNGRATLFCGVSEDLRTQYSAKKLLGVFAEPLGGKGGGRDDFAQGGAPGLNDFESACDTLKAHLSQN